MKFELLIVLACIVLISLAASGHGDHYNTHDLTRCGKGVLAGTGIYAVIKAYSIYKK